MSVRQCLKLQPESIVRLLESAVRVRVREGAVLVESHRVEAGMELTLRSDGSLDRQKVASHGPAWSWVLKAAPPLAIEGLTVEEFLNRVARETGWQIRYADPEIAESAGTIVVTAHYDHVGIGRPDETGDSIYNGADDDASGTAAVLEVAEALATLPRAPARSILVVFVSGEEKGLLGSRWFSDHPTVPHEAMIANVNIDMIGRNAPDSIVVIGQEYSDLGDIVHDVARRNPDLGLTVSEDLWPDERFFFRSDHFHFARNEIPALFFFAGTHEDYHRPGDEVQDIDGDKAARVARLAFLLTYEVAQDPDAPEWTPAGLAEVRRLTAQ